MDPSLYFFLIWMKFVWHLCRKKILLSQILIHFLFRRRAVVSLVSLSSFLPTPFYCQESNVASKYFDALTASLADPLDCLVVLHFPPSLSLFFFFLLFRSLISCWMRREMEKRDGEERWRREKRRPLWPMIQKRQWFLWFPVQYFSVYCKGNKVTKDRRMNGSLKVESWDEIIQFIPLFLHLFFRAIPLIVCRLGQNDPFLSVRLFYSRNSPKCSYLSKKL